MFVPAVPASAQKPPTCVPVMVVPLLILYVNDVVPVPRRMFENHVSRIWEKSKLMLSGGVVSTTVSVAFAGKGPTNVVLAMLGNLTPIFHLPFLIAAAIRASSAARTAAA